MTSLKSINDFHYMNAQKTLTVKNNPKLKIESTVCEVIASNYGDVDESLNAADCGG